MSRLAIDAFFGRNNYRSDRYVSSQRSQTKIAVFAMAGILPPITSVTESEDEAIFFVVLNNKYSCVTVQ